MNKFYVNCLLPVFLLGVVLSFSSCGDDEDSLLDQEHDRYNEFVSADIENVLKNTLGMTIYRGINPPNIEGYYMMETNCVESSIGGDAYVGKKINDYRLHFYDQEDISVSFLGCEMKTGTNIKLSEHIALGTFITGEGDKFSVFFDEKTTDNTNNYVTTQMTVLSGEVVRDEQGAVAGIKNVQYAYVMKENNGKPNTMPNGSARLFEDSYVEVITKEEFETVVTPTRSSDTVTDRGLTISGLE